MSVTGEADERAASIRRDAEEQAAARLAAAELEARRRVDASAREAGELAAGRRRQLIELRDAMVERSAPVRSVIDRDPETKARLDDLLDSLDELAGRLERLATPAVPADAPEPATPEPSASVEEPAPAEDSAPANGRAYGAARPPSSAAPPGALTEGDDAEAQEVSEGMHLLITRWARAGASPEEIEARLRDDLGVSDARTIVATIFEPR